jgi:hypothetical protein
MLSRMTTGTYPTRLVLTVGGERWVKDTGLPTAPFPGLGIRVDTYEGLNVAAVTIGTADCDTECTVEEDAPARGLTERQCLSYGFRRDTDPNPPDPAAVPAPAPDRQAVHGTLVVVDGKLGTWQRPLTLPFPPFDGLRIRLDAGAVLSVLTVVVEDCWDGTVTCIATFDEAHRPRSEQDFEVQGFEERLSGYP